MTLIHICRPRYCRAALEQLKCPTCSLWTWHTTYYEVWYGGTIICLACGDNWQDGERGERPFERAWRKKAVQNAINHFARVGPIAWHDTEELA